MAVNKEIWARLIESNIFKGNPHLLTCTRADEYVTMGKYVHIPQAGSKPNVEINRGSVPATVGSRADGDIVYQLDEYTSDPVLIANADLVELSYDKMIDVMGDHIAAIAEKAGDYSIWNWLRVFSFTGSTTAVATPVIRTTGDAVAGHLDATTATNRKKFVKNDLKKAQFLMNKANIDKADRYALFSSEMLEQLMDDADLIKRDVSAELDMKNGVITRLYGFNVQERSTTAIYTNASTPVVKAPTDAAAATDNDSVICYQKRAAEFAMGVTEIFEKEKDPQYYGDIISALCRAGGRKRRTNSEGLIAIVQAASA